jgi:hypothetical protein
MSQYHYQKIITLKSLLLSLCVIIIIPTNKKIP